MRFFAIAKNDFTTFGLTVMVAATPGSIPVEPIPEEGELIPEEEEPIPEEEEMIPEEEEMPSEEEEPDLAVTNVTTASSSVQSGDRIALLITLANANAPEKAETVRVYRHTAETTNPSQGGTGRHWRG